MQPARAQRPTGGAPATPGPGVGAAARPTSPAAAATTTAGTRGRVLDDVVSHGPTTTAEVASRLGLTAAGVRRHVEALVGEGLLAHQDEGLRGRRGPGRPARRFVATDSAHRRGPDEHDDLAVDLLRFLAQTQGREAVRAFAARRAQELEQRYAPAVTAAGDDVAERAVVLAELLGSDGYAASARPLPERPGRPGLPGRPGAGRQAGGTPAAAAQLCQGHCPVGRAAAEFPELCDAETTAFSSLLGVDTRRLATLGHGHHVCTTHVPLDRTSSAHPETHHHRHHTSSSPEGLRR